MSAHPKSFPEEKSKMHPRNPHRFRYDFPELIKTSPELADFVSLNNFQDLSIDFKDPYAVKALNRALLKAFYGIAFWDIPEGYLCPPIPGRADYIHYMADLLASYNGGQIPLGNTVKVLDIGTGANCIYPIIGHKAYGWNFVGSESEEGAVRSAKNIIEANSLSKFIKIRKQASPASIFEGIIKPGERFDLSICNPPFHSSALEAQQGSQRKWKNLGHKKQGSPVLNFGGRNSELWCEGGEEKFVIRMIEESARFSESCRWFSSLVSKKTTLPAAYYTLKNAGVAEVQTIDMEQGQKISRILAWTFSEMP